MNEQPEALRLADVLESRCVPAPLCEKAAAELRRLHEKNTRLTECLFQAQEAAKQLARHPAMDMPHDQKVAHAYGIKE